jgi:hypothetical protein
MIVDLSDFFVRQNDTQREESSHQLHQPCSAVCYFQLTMTSCIGLHGDCTSRLIISCGSNYRVFAAETRMPSNDSSKKLSHNAMDPMKSLLNGQPLHFDCSPGTDRLTRGAGKNLIITLAVEACSSGVASEGKTCCGNNGCQESRRAKTASEYTPQRLSVAYRCQRIWVMDQSSHLPVQANTVIQRKIPVHRMI